MSHTAQLASPVLGIGGTSGRIWKEQRKTSLEILRELGMGKNLLADKIQEEVTHYIRALEDLEGAPVDLSKLTRVSVSNNICSIVFGQRFEYDDSGFRDCLNAMDQLFKILAGRFSKKLPFWILLSTFLSLQKLRFMDTIFVTLLLTIYETLKRLSQLLMQNDSLCVWMCVRA